MKQIVSYYEVMNNRHRTVRAHGTEASNEEWIGCGAQFFFSCLAAYTQCYLLAAMFYDCCAAICKPLLYSGTMSASVCLGLLLGSNTGGFLNAIAHTANTFRLSFCGRNVIDHFLCDVLPLVKMSCTDTRVYVIILSTIVGFTVLSSLLAILISYLNILLAILRIRSASGRRKAFSTCASHLVSVMLFYGSLLFVYSRPSSSYTLKRVKVATLLYTIINPLLNPVIYSFRNKDVKEAFRKAILSIGPPSGSLFYVFIAVHKLPFCRHVCMSFCSPIKHDNLYSEM
ncbi:LOW QUALITY PROTEIN: olfactory receptor 9G4-like [Sciurus carolinensis]|uniref:LOW QUALITY PROTEIN: olfactory receptor 9G4-like n=1 Tax=Sciurus carolinensis TaxID=30640 RepID=UPI001FB478D1|nr:LOW QUALITY PROTEIN: olfactory receptor 9G4-like [Sciurus carolinensis]